MSRRKQLNPKALKEEEENNEKRMRSRGYSEGEVKVEEEIIDSTQDLIQSNIKNERDDLIQLQCALCDGRFDSVALLQMHTITFHVPQSSTLLPSLVCPQCNSILPSLGAFALHMKSHLSENKLNCPICRKAFRGEEEYLEHLSDHLVVKSVHHSCTPCSLQREVKFKQEGEYLVHSMEKHARLQISCAICEKIFDDDYSFKMHSLSDHSDSHLHFHCSSCDKEFDSRLEMHSHLHSVHSNSLTPIVQSESDIEEKELRVLHCPVCDQKCKGEDALDDHRLFTHCKITRSDSCGDCHLPLFTRSHFIEHCEKHATDSQMSCVVCRQTLRSVAQLNVHASFHSFEDLPQSRSSSINEEKNEELHPLPSPIAIHSLPISSTLTSKVSSEPSKVFRCYICGFRFNSQSRLDTHIRKHASSLSATCQICGDQFPKQDQLVMHMQSHKQNLTERARESIAVNGL
ncbi:hypothetical protein PFISCL1PPCAC_19727 [Pristionchus fissidentatus]|uniref:C2H2-type domain-containing protein n=1 Tax=Pristionchus fissidentatus TaxID=1538716 RepID=A0AAV5W9P5_9BILA|nr:hypothetical protein PFISCL1PPCAC_19727 [Pristionchus fissidentatus]